MKKLLEIIWPKSKSRPIKVQLVSSSAITLDQWRKQDNLVSAMKALERDSTYQMAMAVLQNSHPRHTVFAPMGVNPNDRIVHQAKIEGYELCLNNLAAMGTQTKVLQPLVARFEPPK